MLKVMSLLKRRDGLSLDEFKRWAELEHPKLAMQIPGMEGYRMNVCLVENASAPCDAVSEMWFADEAARVSGFATDAGKAAAADAASHCASRTHLMLHETIIR
jgi:uncharacterized protein (TIGR02118 family)